MIRYFNSFLLSIFIHITIFITLFYIWQNQKSLKKEELNQQNITTFSLSNIIIEKEKKIIKKKKIITRTTLPKKIKTKNIPIKKKPVKKKPIIQTNKQTKAKKEKVTKTKNIINKKEKQQKVITKQNKNLDEQEKIAIIIRTMIEENKYYPKSARRRGIQGIVKVQFTLTKTGKIVSLKLLSKHKILMKSLKKTISNISDEFPRTKSDLTLKINIKFTLKR